MRGPTDTKIPPHTPYKNRPIMMHHTSVIKVMAEPRMAINPSKIIMFLRPYCIGQAAMGPPTVNPRMLALVMTLL